MPICVEQTNRMFPGKKTTMSDFVFDVELDESLFCVEPPDGYQIERVRKGASPPDEQDRVETLRRHSQLSGGPFPGELSWEEILPMADKFSEKQTEGGLAATMRLTRGIGFAYQLPPESDAHYAGKGVSQGKADTPIFWYRPKDAKRYRVIRADLSVGEADGPPSVSHAQPVRPRSGPRR